MIALPTTRRAQWLAPNFELIEAIAQAGGGLVDLWESSPIRLDNEWSAS
jgi:hypothetical protein